ncbi:hypothetical protein [Aquisphaera insulae]|uniref:hypothetical protein n=1 Tax=Aquisphaera insulae TaxID=2712864 RepID=UPI0013EC7AAD|nr:hypothetical protein [Aquisphaera insulae]
MIKGQNLEKCSFVVVTFREERPTFVAFDVKKPAQSTEVTAILSSTRPLTPERLLESPGKSLTEDQKLRKVTIWLLDKNWEVIAVKEGPDTLAAPKALLAVTGPGDIGTPITPTPLPPKSNPYAPTAP